MVRRDHSTDRSGLCPPQHRAERQCGIPAVRHRRRFQQHIQQTSGLPGAAHVAQRPQGLAAHIRVRPLGLPGQSIRRTHRHAFAHRRNQLELHFAARGPELRDDGRIDTGTP